MAPPASQRLAELLDAARAPEKRGIIVCGIAAATTASLVAGLTLLYKKSRAPPATGRFRTESPLQKHEYLAVIVGAGPSGSACGYYLASALAEGQKVAMLDKARFPRDKYCGDACCTPALAIMDDMGVLAELVAAGEAHFADSGGFVSPLGISYIGASKEKLGQAACAAVKRVHLDARMAKAAVKAGAELKEEFEVVDATFDAAAGLWTVVAADGRSVKGRQLVIADGATSRLATKLGYCTEAPRGVCTRAFVEGATHNTNFDGVCFYPKWSLPGYAAIFRHPNDELNFCYYLIPCGPNKSKGQCGAVDEADLARLHAEAIRRDPYISAALGPDAKIERTRAASLRLGGQGISTTVDDHLIIVGDAAGHIDPLTGEGIHTAMMGGKAAAGAIAAMARSGDFSRRSQRAYEREWRRLFGRDFFWSKVFAGAIYRCPLLLDAMASEMQRKGDAAMARWAEVMTCLKPKTHLLRPDVALPLGLAVAREAFEQVVLGKPDRYRLLPAAAAAAGGAGAGAGAGSAAPGAAAAAAGGK